MKMKLFRHKKIDQEFENENSLILQIMGNEGFNKLKTILSFMGYSSPGKWLNQEKEEWRKVFNNPLYFEKRRFFLRREHSPYRLFYYHLKQERIFNKFCFEFINHEFNNSQNSIDELSILLNNFSNVNNCVPNEFKFNAFISHMNTQLKNRISSENCNQFIEIDGNKDERSKSGTKEKNIINYITSNQFVFNKIDNHRTQIQYNSTEINKTTIVNSIHDDRVGIQFKLISDIELFDNFCQKLFDFGFISSLELFKNPFIGKMIKDGERSRWNLNLNALAFLIVIFRNTGLTHVPNDIYKAINESFRDKDGKDINSGSLSTQSSRIGLTSLGKDIKTINEYVSQSTNNDIKLIYHTFLKTYTELRDSLD